METPPKLQSFSLNILSKILSYGHEYDGTCTLLTCRKLAQRLPMFQIDDNVIRLVDVEKSNPMLNLDVMNNTFRKAGAKIRNRNRHMYREIPVYDPSVLLDRLNTRRLYKQILYVRKQNPLGSHGNRSYSFDRTIKNLVMDDDTFGCPASMRMLRFRYQQRGAEKRENDACPVLLASYPRSGNSLVRSLIGEWRAIIFKSYCNAACNDSMLYVF
mmetsp:Transcript_5798/g.8557  ORF Transcript_5798/g.8557 Transcript_5798/m.8557 type:complete len:214 (-) Transcript_5798:198-839(-)